VVNFGVIVSDESYDKSTALKIINKFLPRAAADLLTFNWKKCECKAIQGAIQEIDFNIFVIKAPFSKQYLNTLNKNIIEKVCEQLKIRLLSNQIKHIMIPENIGKYQEYIHAFLTDNKFAISQGKEILTCLAVDILKKLSKITDMEITDMDIAVLDMQLTNKSRYLINVLSSCARYITLITRDIQTAEEYARQVFENTGLSIRVTDACAITQRPYHILFIAEKPEGADLRKITGSKTIIFYLGSERILINKAYRLLVDGISTTFNGITFSQTGLVDISEQTGIFEMIMLIQMEKYPDQLAAEDYAVIRNKFYELGGVITALKSSQRPVKFSNLQEYI